MAMPLGVDCMWDRTEAHFDHRCRVACALLHCALRIESGPQTDEGDIADMRKTAALCAVQTSPKPPVDRRPLALVIEEVLARARRASHVTHVSRGSGHYDGEVGGRVVLDDSEQALVVDSVRVVARRRQPYGHTWPKSRKPKCVDGGKMTCQYYAHGCGPMPPPGPSSRGALQRPAAILTASYVRCGSASSRTIHISGGTTVYTLKPLPGPSMRVG